MLRFAQGVVTALAVVVLCGQAKDKDGTLRVKQLEVVDADGEVVARIDGDGRIHAQVIDAKYVRCKRGSATDSIIVRGKGAVQASTLRGDGLSVHGGTYGASVVATQKEAAIHLTRLKKGAPFVRAQLRSDDQGPAAELTDSKGKVIWRAPK